MNKFNTKKLKPLTMTNIAIFASGSGSNAENIIRHFEKNSDVTVALILTNNSSAYVIERAKKLNIPVVVFSRHELNNSDIIANYLNDYKIDYIVLAGFLLLVPRSIIERYEGRIINIHPALLPNYGGKGMYGDKVHIAVRESGDVKTGITIHHVNEKFDSGDIIFQACCDVLPEETAEDIAAKVHELEYRYFPSVIAQQIENL